MANFKRGSKRKRILKYLGNVGFVTFLFILIVSPVSTAHTEAVNQIISSDKKATKDIINTALTATKGKPAMLSAMTIVCITCFPVACDAASPSFCIACGILFAKTIG